MMTIISPKRPYLLKAYYDWISDNDLTPYLVVDANYYNVDVPREYVEDGKITLNISARATGGLIIDPSCVQFHARFNGIERQVYVPMGAVMAIYARENGDGLMFEPEDTYEQENRLAEASVQKQKEDHSFLKIIK